MTLVNFFGLHTSTIIFTKPSLETTEGVKHAISIKLVLLNNQKVYRIKHETIITTCMKENIQENAVSFNVIDNSSQEYKIFKCFLVSSFCLIHILFSLENTK